MKAALYDEAALPAKGMMVEAKETVDLLQGIIEGKRSAEGVLGVGGAADTGFYTRLLNGLTAEVKRNGKRVRVLKRVEARDLLNATKELTQRLSASFADPFTAANKGALKKVSATMERELTEAIRKADPKLADRIAVADATYQEGIARINSTFGVSIHRLARAGQYDRIAQAVANARMSLDDIPKIMEVAGSEGTEAIRMAVLADIVGKAKNPAGQLTPQGLGRAIKGYGEDRLAALLTPEQLGKLRDVSTLSGSLDKGTKVMGGSQTAFLARIGGYPAWFWADPINAMLALAGDVAATRFVASASGQRWLTNGWNPTGPGTKTAAAAVASGQTGQPAE
jgi:hypothetical protein